MMEDKENPLMCLDYNPDGTLFATAGNDRQVRIYDDNMKSIVSTMKPGLSHPGHSNRIFALNFHKTIIGLLASGGWDNTVQFYDIRTSNITNSIYGPHICGDAIDFKDNLLLTGSWSSKDQIQLWDIRTYKLLSTVQWDCLGTEESTYCYSAQFSKDKSSTLFGVGCSNKNMFRLFDNDNDALPITSSDLYKACYSVDFSQNGKNVAYGCGDGNIRVLNIDKK
jgi:WD40 repeat protein